MNKKTNKGLYYKPLSVEGQKVNINKNEAQEIRWSNEY